MLKNIRKFNLVFLTVAVILVLPAILTFLRSGFPQTDDGNWMVIRFSAFYEALRAGQVPARFLLRLNNGFGYPVSDFLYPLFMYLGVPIHILGFNFTWTIKILFIFSIIFSSTFTFLWLRKIFDNLSSIIGSVFYTLFPYHLFDIYKRGSLGEALSFSVLPFVLWQIERESSFWISIGVFLLILSHNTLALFFLPLIIGFAYFRKKLNKLIRPILFGFLMSSFFWLPAIYDLQFTVFSKTKISDFNSYFSDSLTLSLLGLTFCFLLLELIFLFFRTRKIKIFYSFLFLIFISFFLFSASKPIWQLLPVTNFIQFPFRLISVLIPVSSFLVAFLINKEEKSKKYFLSIIYIVLIFISGFSFLNPKTIQNYPDTFYSTNLDTTTVKDEYMPKWVIQKPQFTANKVQIINGKEQVNLQIFNDKTIKFNAFLLTKKIVKINVVYFPGWVAYVNGIQTVIDYENNGIMTLNLDKGQNDVELEFRESGVRLIADFLSIIGLLSLLYYSYKNKIK